MITESRFYMCRTLLALIHSDFKVTDDELEFIENLFTCLDLSENQKEILSREIGSPQNAQEMFRGITDPKDQETFFNLAYDLMIVDGDYNSREYEVIKLLQAEYDSSRGMQSGASEVDLVLERRKGALEDDEPDFETVLGHLKDYM